MKITKGMVGVFEHDQKNKGTKLAIQNIVWQVASSLLNDIGVVKIHTSYKKKVKKGNI